MAARCGATASRPVNVRAAHCAASKCKLGKIPAGAQLTNKPTAAGPAVCEAPLGVAAELLRADGFTDIRYVDTSADDLSAAIAQRKVDFALDFPVLFAPAIDAGQPVTVLAGVHVGCFELFAASDVRTIADLKGKTVGCELAPAALLRLMAAQVGLDPDKDIG